MPWVCYRGVVTRINLDYHQIKALAKNPKDYRLFMPVGYMDNFAKPGGLLSVMEEWGEVDALGGSQLVYRADYPSGHLDDVTWFPASKLNFWGSRLSLRIESITPATMDTMTEQDARWLGLGRITKDGTLYKWGASDRDGLPGTDNTGWDWRAWNADMHMAYRGHWLSIFARKTFRNVPRSPKDRHVGFKPVHQTKGLIWKFRIIRTGALHV